MIRFVLLACCLVILNHCSNRWGHGASSAGLVAWNEDTTSPALFKIYKHRKFEYSITWHGKTEIATGSLKYGDERIYLIYKNYMQPAGMSNVLIMEASGKYLIQLASQDRPRLVLRIQGEPEH